MKKMHLLIAESSNFCSEAIDLLQSRVDLELADIDRSGLIDAVKFIDILWVRLRNRIDADIMRAAPRLNFIVTNTTGLNHIDIDEAEKRGIQVVSLRGETEFLKDIHATAELTLALMLMSVRRLPSACGHVLSGGWNRDLFRGHELFRKTAGIVGYGRLGRIVASYLKYLGMKVLVCDPAVTFDKVESGIELLTLDELLQVSDVVSLHVNLSKTTTRFFGRREFSLMKPGSWLINTARGELIDERALLDALNTGRLMGAALDVLCGESSLNMQGHPLIEYARHNDNLILTPHIGGNTVESTEHTEMFLARKLLKIIGYTL